MKKILITTAITVGLFTGCSIETAYLTGESVGKQILSKDVKNKIRPINRVIKKGYKILKKGNDQTVTTSKVTEKLSFVGGR